MAEDGIHVVATGVYKPQVKVFDTRELSMKFERHLDAEVVQFEILSEDFTKLVFLGNDRSLSFHAGYGHHFKLRIPRFGRDLAYDRFACELFACGATNEIYRIDLERGHFLQPFETVHSGVNALNFCDPLQMLACGGEDGTVTCWDPREKKQVGFLDLKDSEGTEITRLEFDRLGLIMAVGTSAGKVKVFDIRSSKPLAVKDHRNGVGITGIAFEHPGRKIISSDAYSIKIWNHDSGEGFVNVEPQANVNDILLVPQTTSASRSSGLIIAAGETQRIMNYYIPALGPAPKWSYFLDNLTEELEEKDRSEEDLYDSYKFVSNEDLERLGITNLLGTPLLRAYMHGYFMDMRLYNRVQAVSQPLGFEAWRKQRIKEKMEKRLGQRISRKKPENLPKVNKDLAIRLSASASSKKKKKDESEMVGSSILKDERFKAVFEDKDFEIDTNAEEFRQMYPSGLKTTSRTDAVNFSESEDEDEDDAENKNIIEEHENSEGQNPQEVPQKSEETTATKKKTGKRITMASSKEASLLEYLDKEPQDKKRRKERSLGKELQEATQTLSEVRKLEGGNLEAIFTPKSDKKHKKKMRK